MFDFLYDSTALTTQINRVPNMFGLIGGLGLFEDEPIGSTTVEIRENEEGVVVLNSTERSGGAQDRDDRKRGKTRTFTTAHFEKPGVIRPADVQDRLRVLGREKVAESVDQVLAEKLARLARDHYQTIEWLRLGALKGKILDGDGTTVLLDLHAFFGKEQETVYFDLTNEDADVLAQCEAVGDHIGQNLNGEMMSGVTGIVSTRFFNRFVQHPKVEKYYLQHQAALSLNKPERDMRGGNWGRKFDFNGQVELIEYKGKAPLKTGAVDCVTAGDAHFFPTGTMDTFRTAYSPPDTMSEVNIPPDLESDADFGGFFQLFASAEVLKHNKGVELYTESNPTPYVKRPELLVLGKDGADPG
ncbi:MAG: hypothetical protein CMF76_09220 [Maricaulis sp.]|nr:hypothetical protein [Maricaulis sp.]